MRSADREDTGAASGLGKPASGIPSDGKPPSGTVGDTDPPSGNPVLNPGVFPYCKLEIFLPETHLEPLREALLSVDAGHIGRYDACLSYSPVTGCWRPLDGTRPYLGRTGEISSEPELKVEVTCRTEQVRETVAAVKRVHPYEEPVINVIPLWAVGL